MTDFIDNPNEKSLEISGGAPIPPDIIPLPPSPPPTPMPPDDKIIPWNPQGSEPIRTMDASAITGQFDSWAAVVDKVHATTRAVEVTRSDVIWGANETPVGKSIASASSQPQTAIATAYPFPPRHDQAGHIISVGDIVTCITGRDGRVWYLNDELPFIGQVVAKQGDDVTEDNTGGAGLTTLTVRRQAMGGDPDNALFTGAELAGLVNLVGAEIRYSNVLVIKSPTSHHGYRVGDYVMVQRRGRYYFAVPARETFTAFVVNAGPDGEADFTDNRYWVREYKNAVIYAGLNSYTLTPTSMTQTDPTGSGGRAGRWVQATNNGEAATKHGLYTENEAAGPANAVKVAVSMYADISDGEPWYSFNKTIAISEVTDGTTTVDPCDKLTFTAGAGITTVVTDNGNDDAEVTIACTVTDTDTKIGEVGDTPDTVTNCDKITFVGATVDDDGNGDAIVTISDTSWPGDTNFIQLGKWIDVDFSYFNGEIKTVTDNNNGTGYVNGDVLTIEPAGDGNGTVTVTAVDGAGAVTAVSLTTGGSGYSVAYNLAVTGGTGNDDATIDITDILVKKTYTISSADFRGRGIWKCNPALVNGTPAAARSAYWTDGDTLDVRHMVIGDTHASDVLLWRATHFAGYGLMEILVSGTDGHLELYVEGDAASTRCQVWVTITATGNKTEADISAPD